LVARLLRSRPERTPIASDLLSTGLAYLAQEKQIANGATIASRLTPGVQSNSVAKNEPKNASVTTPSKGRMLADMTGRP